MSDIGSRAVGLDDNFVVGFIIIWLRGFTVKEIKKMLHWERIVRIWICC